MRKTSKNLVGSASKTSLILSPCGHWMDRRAGSGRSTSQSNFGTDVHASIEAYLLGRFDSVRPEHLETYCKPAAKFVESISSGVDGTADPILIEESMFVSVNGELSGCIEDYSELDGMDGTFFAGTADVVVLHDERRATVIDWKTGSGFYARDQLRSLGGLACSVYDDTVSVRMISAEVRPGDIRAALDFEESSVELSTHLNNVLHNLRRGPTLPVVGSHCYEHFCPHSESCQGIQKEFYSAKNLEPTDLGLLDDEAMYRMFCATTSTLKDAESAKDRLLSEARKRGGLKHSGGFFTENFRNVNRLKLDDVLSLARSKGITDAEIDLCRHPNRESAGWRNKK